MQNLNVHNFAYEVICALLFSGSVFTLRSQAELACNCFVILCSCCLWDFSWPHIFSRSFLCAFSAVPDFCITLPFFLLFCLVFVSHLIMEILAAKRIFA